jgi:bifunctional non-homologous end joining protein LigD
MLAKSGPIPTRGSWVYEVKWDGFRALVRGGGHLRIRSRRGWDMTPVVPEFEGLPDAIFDGELVAFEDGAPSFPLVCQRILNRDTSIPLTLIVFDVLAYRGRSLAGEPYRKRRNVLERIDFRGRAHFPEVFSDGAGLFEAVCEQELEGIVAKRVNEPYRPSYRGWVKTKNRDYWRHEMEREAAFNVKRELPCV